MIHFFRRIRQGLINKERVGKYLLYAIGEILLVVIGILIALQINNSNEQRKDRKLEVQLLRGIKTDLEDDLDQINGRVNNSHRDLQLTIARFDSVVKMNDVNLNYLDSIFFNRCIRPRNTLFPKFGTYNSIINNGNSSIIQNYELFKKIQLQYDQYYEGRISSGNRMDLFNDDFMHEMNKSRALNDEERLNFFKNPTTLNELNFWLEKNEHYNKNVNTMAKGSLKTLVDMINEELIKLEN